MVCNFKHSTEKVGLNCSQSSSRRKDVEIDSIKVEKLTREKSTTYLGQLVTFQQQETTEIKNRIGLPGRRFTNTNKRLTSKSYLLRHRLRLFDMVITPTMNFASGTWTLSKKNMKERFNRRSAKCSDSSYKRKEKTRKRLRTKM